MVDIVNVLKHKKKIVIFRNIITSMYIIMHNDVYIVIIHSNLLSQIMNDIFPRNVTYNQNNYFMTS